MTDRGWPDAVNRTWLSKTRTCKDLDEQLRVWLAGHRVLKKDEVRLPLPFVSSKAPLIMDMKDQLLALGRENLWYWCSTAISITGELLFAAKSGGVFSPETRVEWTNWNKNAGPDVEVLRILRNVFCHPAHQRDTKSGIPHITSLLNHLKTNTGEHELAAMIAQDWSTVGSSQVARFALQKLNVAGRHFCERYGIPIKD